MTELLPVVALLMVTGLATAAAHTADPARQAVVLAGLGLALSLLFTVLQAPDVALSQIGVGTAVTPLLILLTVRKVRRAPRRSGLENGNQDGNQDGNENANNGNKVGKEPPR